jgi:hypothetical protein
MRLATTLGTADWREIAGDTHLAPPLRTHAADLLRAGDSRRA